MSQGAVDILAQAIGRNSAVVLSLPSAGMLRHHKSRFLNETPEGVWLESVPTEQILIQSLITDGTPCGISFKSTEKKVSFASKILKCEPEYRINADTVVQAVLIGKPAEVKAVQRRHNYRVRVPADSELLLKVWRIPEHVRVKDKPVRAAELDVKLLDISTGGVGMMVMGKDGAPPKVLEGERLRIVLKMGEEEIIVEGRMRAARGAAKELRVTTGVQFQKLQDGLEGRQILTALTKIVGALQLEEVRRHRLGIA